MKKREELHRILSPLGINVYLDYEKGIELSYTSALLKHVGEKSYSAKFGARNMRRFIQTHIEDAIAEKVIADYNHTITKVHLNISDGEIAVTCM